MKKPKLKQKKINATEISGLPTDIFMRIVGSLRRQPSCAEIKAGSGDNDAGWVLPLAPGSGDPWEEGGGWLVLFPACIDRHATRRLISQTLKIELEKCDVVVIHDCR